MPDSDNPRLYGLTAENSNRTGKELWGKNQFNANFPVALCLKMRDDRVKPIYVYVNQNHEIRSDDTILSMEEIVENKNEGYFDFESHFPPYHRYTDGKEKIDVVVSRWILGGRQKIPIRPLEIKLTVVPDSSTLTSEQDYWAPELVLLPISSAFAMMGLASKLLEDTNSDRLQAVKRALEPCRRELRRADWENVSAIHQHSELLVSVLTDALNVVTHLQKPFLVQPIWRTEGQTLALSDNCFDVFVWSDLAIVKIPLDQVNLRNKKMSRYLREIARHVFALNSVCTTGSFNYQDTYEPWICLYKLTNHFRSAVK